jgi:hypothetical protein
MLTGKYHSFKCIICSAIALLVFAHKATLAAPNSAIRAACHEDAKRLCADLLGNPEAVRACMREHHEQLSDKCKSTIAGVKVGEKSAQGKNPEVRSFASRRERCIAYVQQDYRYKPKQGARPALERCMHGEPIPAGFNEREGF